MDFCSESGAAPKEAVAAPKGAVAAPKGLAAAAPSGKLPNGRLPRPGVHYVQGEEL